MENFKGFNLPESLQHTLEHMGFEKPTPIQEKAIPVSLEGHDILGSAQTGTGKTGAFGIPLIAKLLSDPQSCALVMTPTRELAAQVLTQLKKMAGKHSKIKSALLIGGDSIHKQLNALSGNPRLIVGTPGRINDHLERNSLNLEKTNFLVMDETDRMLDMGFTIQIEQILKFMPAERQTLLFSATLPKDIVKISEKYLNNPKRIAIEEESVLHKNIDHKIVNISEGKKYQSFLGELAERDGTIIVFVKTKRRAESMAQEISEKGFSAAAIHGDLRQSKRDRVIANFRRQKYKILIATDVAARGLDIPHIEHVINYDLPQCAEDYLHRIGRTARAGAEGSAMCFVTAADRGMWKEIDYLMNPDAYPNGKPKSSNNGRSYGGNRPSRFRSGPSTARNNGKPARFNRKQSSNKGRKTAASNSNSSKFDNKKANNKRPAKLGKPSDSNSTKVIGRRKSSNIKNPKFGKSLSGKNKLSLKKKSSFANAAA